MDISVLESSSESIDAGATYGRRFDVGTSKLQPKYPVNVAGDDSNHDNYLIFTISEAIEDYTFSSLKKMQESYMSNPLKYKSVDNICIYTPAIKDRLAHNYTESNLGSATEIAQSIIQDQSVKNVLETGYNALVQEVQNNKAFSQTSGKIQRNLISAMYKGTALREHTFKFDLIAQDNSELIEIHKIIYLFRKYSCATHTSTDYGTANALGTMKMPHLWNVIERVKKSQSANVRTSAPFSLATAVVTGVEVDNAPNQINQTIAGTMGDPMHIILTVTMKETIPVTSQYWKDVEKLKFI